MSVYVVAERKMPPRMFCQRLPAFRLPRARARSVHPSILPSRSRSSRGRGTVENRNIQPRQELFGVFAGAVLCGISGFCLDGLWKSASGGGFGGIFWCPAAFRPRQTGRCGRIFSVFCGKAGGSVHRHLWTSGGACGWLGEFVRPVFYAYPQDSGGRVFLLQCPDSRSAGGAYGYAYRAFQHSFPQAVKKAGKSPQSFPHGVENRGCFRQWRCGERKFGARGVACPLAALAVPAAVVPGGGRGLAPLRHLLALPRGRGPSQTPKFLSPGPPSPWLPALFTSTAS